MFRDLGPLGTDPHLLMRTGGDGGIRDTAVPTSTNLRWCQSWR
jgi:hypothetical protein